MVKWWNEKKGWGFILSGNKEYFAHYHKILGKGRRNLKAGESVEFTPLMGQRGLYAVDIKRVLNAAVPRTNTKHYATNSQSEKRVPYNNLMPPNCE